MDGRIRRIDLRILAEDPSPQTKALATSFARRVMERADTLLEERAPKRVVVARSVETTWRLLHGALELGDEVEAFARDVANWLHDRAEILLARGDGRSADDGELAVFVDEPEWRARHLAEHARGQRPWWGASLDDEGPPAEVLARLPSLEIGTVLGRLAKAGDLAETLRALPDGAARTLVDRIPTARALVAELSSAGDDSSASESDATLPAWITDGITRFEGRDGDERRALALTAMLRWLEESGAPASIALRGAMIHRASARSALRAPDRDAARGRAGEDRGRAVDRTEFGGLAYLLNPLLELECAKHIWTACLSEGNVIAAAMRLLLGGAGAHDAAPEAIGGVKRAAPPVVPEEALREVASRSLAALVEEIPRRALATFPAVRVSRVDHLLLVTPEGSPYVLFAWPGARPRDVQEGLGVLLRRWPHTSPIFASPALAELDPSSRLRRRAAPAAAPLLPASLAPSAAGLLAMVAGSSASLFGLRVGAELGDANAVRDRFFAIRGAILRPDDDSLIFTLPMDRIDLDVRRAGLDRDPGWVPWLRRTVRIEFDEGLDAA